MKFTIGVKKEMTQVFNKEGIVSPVTLVDISKAMVIGRRNKDKDGYNAVILGYGSKKRSTKAQKQAYKGVSELPEKVSEFRVEVLDDANTNQNGKSVDFEVKEGEKVIVSGVTKGKGFAGVVKRWGFKGGPKTHGQSDRQRAPGSIGSGTTPGRIYKGKRMAGRMGGKIQTVKNLVVKKYDKEAGILYIKGALPGPKSGFLLIKTEA